MTAIAAKLYVSLRKYQEFFHKKSKTFEQSIRLNPFNYNNRVIVKLWGSSKMLETIHVYIYRFNRDKVIDRIRYERNQTKQIPLKDCGQRENDRMNKRYDKDYVED